MVGTPCHQVEVLVDNLSDQGCLFLLLRLDRARASVAGRSAGAAERFDRRCNDRHACLLPSSGKVFVRGGGFILSDQEPNAWQGFCPLILLGKLPG